MFTFLNDLDLANFKRGKDKKKRRKKLLDLGRGVLSKAATTALGSGVAYLLWNRGKSNLSGYAKRVAQGAVIGGVVGGSEKIVTTPSDNPRIKELQAKAYISKRRLDRRIRK